MQIYTQSIEKHIDKCLFKTFTSWVTSNSMEIKNHLLISNHSNHRTSNNTGKALHVTQTSVNQQSHWKGSARNPNLCQPAITLKRLRPWPKLLWTSIHTEKALAWPKPLWAKHRTKMALPLTQTEKAPAWPKPMWAKNHIKKALPTTQTAANQHSHWKGSAHNPNLHGPATALKRLCP